MPQINKKDRDQLQMLAISEHIPQDSLVRIIDLFFDTADMKELGFIVKGKSHEGRRAFFLSKGKRDVHQGRYIALYLGDQAVINNRLNLRDNRPLYKRRQAIVEHPFGTIKRQRGYTHTLLKTIPKVQTEFSIIMLAYNLKRSMSILGAKGLKEALKRSFFHLMTITNSLKHLISIITKSCCDRSWKMVEYSIFRRDLYA